MIKPNFHIMFKFTAIFIIILELVSNHLCLADSKKLPLPRFASIKSSEVNARKGPGINYPIEWIFVTKLEPIEIYAEYEQWRQIRDIKNEGGWVHVSVLSCKRSVIIIGNDIIPLRKTKDSKSRVIAKLSPGVRCSVSKCQKTACRLQCGKYQGWVDKTKLWGVYAEEVFSK